MHHKRIMVVDGSTLSRELIIRQLEDVLEDHEVTACQNAHEALDRLADEQYDLITTAVVLPDMDGLMLCQHIRQSQNNHFTPVIVISGDDDSRLLKEGFAAGVTDYFDKSLGYRALGTFIKDFQERNSGLVGRVLFVEDSTTAATLTMRMLDKQGLQVVHTKTAEEAIELLDKASANGEDFDMVITDFHLKGEMTGGDLLHTVRVKRHCSQQELPVLVITGNDDPQTQVEVFHAGGNDYVTKPLVEEILMARVRSLLLIKHQFNALKHQADEMRRVATTDGLTGVRNRLYMLDRGDAMISDAGQVPVAVFIIDLDHFKQINDGLGHLIGDHVLVAMGKLINETFPDGLNVRFGGEEFVVLLPHTADGRQRAEAFRAAVEQLKPQGVDISCSIGLTHSHDYPEADLNTLLGLADKALYAAKDAGRNRVCVTAPGANSAQEQRVC